MRCADRPGLAAAVTTFGQTGGTFMQRTVFHLSGLTAARDASAGKFAEQVAEMFDMDFRLTEATKPKRVAVMASKEDHCLLDLLWRNRPGHRAMSVAMVLPTIPTWPTRSAHPARRSSTSRPMRRSASRPNDASSTR